MTQTLADVVEEDLLQQRQGPLSGELRKLYRMEGECARRKAARQGLWLAVVVYLSFPSPTYC